MKAQKINSTIIVKLIFFSLILFFIGTITTFAQSERGKQMRNKNATPEEKAEKRTQKWKTELNLNDTQTAQLKTALIKRITATDELKGEEKGQERKTKMTAIMAEFDAQVKSILTPEQYAIYQKKKEEKKNKIKENRGKGKHGRGKNHDSDDDDF